MRETLYLVTPYHKLERFIGPAAGSFDKEFKLDDRGKIDYTAKISSILLHFD